jgi:hypothetical protein
MNNPTYYAVLSANVRYCPDLSAQEKLLFAEITALSNKDGFCSAGNSYFSKLYSLTEPTISRQIKHLEELGFVTVKYDRAGTKITRRYISTVDKNINGNAVTVDKNDNRTIDKNVKENNTSNVNITRLNNIDTDKSVQLVNIFMSGLKRRNPKIDRSDKQKLHYCEVYDKMLEVYSYYELAQMTNFVFNSDFWSKFVITVDLIAKHHEKLYAQCKAYYKISSDATDNSVDF